jgi:hypothetical protein
MSKLAFRCWITEQPDLGGGIACAASPAKARYLVARSAYEVGYLKRANPAQISCLRAKEYDDHPRLIEGMFINSDAFTINHD